MGRTSPFSLELKIEFNGKTLAVIPLQIPAEDAPPNPDGPECSAIKRESSNEISAVLHISGDPTALQSLCEHLEVLHAHLNLNNYPSSRKTTYSYDHRLTSITDPGGFRSTVTYDANGTRLNASDPLPEDPEADPPAIVG